jgi:hypothetical protein
MSPARLSGCLAAALALGLVLGACGIGGPDVSSTAKCDGPAFTSKTEPPAPTRTLILVDLASNRKAARELVTEAIEPVVTQAVVDGGAIRLLVSGGEGRPLAPSPCLDGGAAVFVDRNNPETERRARDTAVAAIEGSVAALLEETAVSARGELANMLAAVPDQIAKISPGPGPRRVLLVSDLTGPETRGGCLGLEGMEALPRIAEAMVARCFEVGQLRHLPAGVELSIVRPQTLPGDGAGTRMSNYLIASLCRQMPEDNRGCGPGPAEKG